MNERKSSRPGSSNPQPYRKEDIVPLGVAGIDPVAEQEHKECGSCKFWGDPWTRQGILVAYCANDMVCQPLSRKQMKINSVLAVGEDGETGELVTGFGFCCCHFCKADMDGASNA